SAQGLWPTRQEQAGCLQNGTFVTFCYKERRDGKKVKQLNSQIRHKQCLKAPQPPLISGPFLRFSKMWVGEPDFRGRSHAALGWHRREEERGELGPAGLGREVSHISTFQPSLWGRAGDGRMGHIFFHSINPCPPTHKLGTTLLLAHFKTEHIKMKRMIIFYMLFFCSTMVLTETSPKTAKYRQILKKIEQLESMVKEKDAELLHTPENPVEGCLNTTVSCFQKGIQKLQPASSHDNAKFTKAIRIVSRFSGTDSREHCESTCESYKKKTPKKFLKGFANLVQMRDMENEKYSNLNNGGKTNTPANFSIAFASIAKFVMKKVQRPSTKGKKHTVMPDFSTEAES
ncbi:Interleukin-21, partial [Lamprotornis superbus]